MSDATLPEHVHENIQSIAQIREQAESALGTGQRVIEATTRVMVRPWIVSALVVAVLAWLGGNGVAVATGHRPLDPPPFFWLQGAVALYVALVSTMVLVTQRREAREAERRAHLEFHVNLLAEQKATKIIALLEELRRDLPNVRDREDKIAQALQEEINPHDVHSALADQSGRRRG